MAPAVPDERADQPGSRAAPDHRRTVRSFVVRAGRMTVAQERAWRELWPQYGIPDGNDVLDLDATFGRRACRTLEIGFGNGESLIALAAAHREGDFLGVEVHRPGVGHLLLRAAALGLTNVRVACCDAIDLLQRRIADGSLDEVLLYFPDPWAKKRHHKRRIVQPAFVALVAGKLRSGGVFRLATDWQHYAEQMLAVLSDSTVLENMAEGTGFAVRPGSRPLTRFESRGQRLGHEVWDLAFRRL